MPVKAIVTDIEGTTTDIGFVHQVLFPYAAKALPDYVRRNFRTENIASVLEAVREEIQQPDSNLDTVIETLLLWIEKDRKITPLKTLQGHIWEHGYINGDFQGHVYPDASHYLNKWHGLGVKLYVYSSGSVNAQKLLFQFSDHGDLSSLFSGFFDTHIGGKKKYQSYQRIVESLQLPANEILFLSDVTAELDAAKRVGMQTTLLERNSNTSPAVDQNHPVARHFQEIHHFLINTMTQLTVYSEVDASTPILTTDDTAHITRELASIGVTYRRWQSDKQFDEHAKQEEILANFDAEIKALISEAGYQSVDVVSLGKQAENTEDMRKKFLSEHTHSDDEVRFFVRGQGQFYLHVDEKVYILLCNQNDLINVPANTKHWFDMGPNPDFTCIRLFNDPKGWEATFTGENIAEKFPLLLN